MYFSIILSSTSAHASIIFSRISWRELLSSSGMLDSAVPLALGLPSKTAARMLTRSMTPLCCPPRRGATGWGRGSCRGAPSCFDAHEEVGAHLVHLVHERDARDLVLVGLAPDGLALRLDAVAAVEHRDRAVEDAQAALDLDREVDVARRVDDVDAVADAVVGPSSGVQKQLVAADVIVMPRSCSWTI